MHVRRAVLGHRAEQVLLHEAHPAIPIVFFILREDVLVIDPAQAVLGCDGHRRPGHSIDAPELRPALQHHAHLRQRVAPRAAVLEAVVLCEDGDRRQVAPKVEHVLQEAVRLARAAKGLAMRQAIVRQKCEVRQLRLLRGLAFAAVAASRTAVTGREEEPRNPPASHLSA